MSSQSYSISRCAVVALAYSYMLSSADFFFFSNAFLALTSYVFQANDITTVYFYWLCVQLKGNCF